MRTRLLGFWAAVAALTAGRSLAGDIVDLAEQCEGGHSGRCQLLYVQDGRVRFRAAGATRARDLGPYLAQLRASVPPPRAPVQEFVLSGDRKLVVAWGFDTRFRSFGPSFWLYFLDSGGRVVAEQKGDVILRFIEAGALFRSSSEMIAVTMQSEAAPALVTMVWRWAEQRAPQLVFAQAGRIDRVDRGSAPGILLASAEDTGHGLRWQLRFYEWHEGTQRFRPRADR